MIYQYEQHLPSLPESGYIANEASVIGNVALAEETSIWFGAVLRGDIDAIRIGEGSNVQDNCTLHTSQGFPVVVGAQTSVGHNVVLHGCSVGNNCLIGSGAVLLNGSTIGDNSIIGAGTLVREGQQIPAGSVAVGNPARILRKVTEQEIAETLDIGRRYIKRYKKYRSGVMKHLQ